MRLRMIIGIPLIAIGLLLLVLAARGWVHRGQFLSDAVETKGKVIGEESYTVTRSAKRGAPGVSDGFRTKQSSSSPIVEFQTRDGKTVTFKSRLGSSSLTDKLVVLYSASDPSHAEIKNYFAQTGWILLLACLAAVFLAGGTVALKLIGSTNPSPRLLNGKGFSDY